MIRLFLASLIIANSFAPAFSDIVIAERNIPAWSVITASDLKMAPGDDPYAASDLIEVVGMQTNTVIFRDQPVLLRQISSPILVERNQIVVVIFERGALRIESAGRALTRGSLGDVVRFINVDSKKVVSGIVQSDGTISVGQP
ncbi:MAG: flagellar basal body P-ring formation chaperone FlgA [Pseudomonadota bacterium]